MEHCKQQRDSVDDYTLYAFYYLEYHVYTLRVANKLHQGTKKLKIDGGEWEYEGEMDENDQACGQGVATFENYGKYSGMWYNDAQEGVSTLDYGYVRYEGEYRAGEKYGKQTVYTSGGYILNETYQNIIRKS